MLARFPCCRQGVMMRESLNAAAVYTPVNALSPGTVRIEGGRIVGIEKGRDRRGEDLDGLIICPGWVDVHIHGLGEYTVDDSDGLLGIAEGLLSRGVTAFLPTVASAPHEEILRVCRSVAAAIDAQRRGGSGARILGLGLEGPYINPKRKGAHEEDFIRTPSWEEFLSYWRASAGAVRVVTVAPELPGGLKFIERVVAHGVTVSIGHTDATYREAVAAITAGATRATHLFNAMRPIHHREPGAVIACLEDPRVHIELICDLVHVSAPMIRLVHRLTGSARLIAISDLISERGPAGLVEGAFRLPDGTLAGGGCALDEAVRTLVKVGLPLDDALMAASATPARACGETGVGLLRLGGWADLIALDPETLVLRRVYLGGKRVL